MLALQEGGCWEKQGGADSTAAQWRVQGEQTPHRQCQVGHQAPRRHRQPQEGPVHHRAFARAGEHAAKHVQQWTDHRYLIGGKPVTVVLTENEATVVRAPEPMVRIAVANLLRNALEQTQQGQVRVSLKGGRADDKRRGRGI